jgi:hypothetical protein
MLRFRLFVCIFQLYFIVICDNKCCVERWQISRGQSNLNSAEICYSGQMSY